MSTASPHPLEPVPARAETARKRKLWLILAPALLVVLLLVFSLALFSHRTNPVAARPWSVAFSPDGKTLVTCGGPDAPTDGAFGEVVFWNASTGKKKRVLAQTAAVRRVVFSPDGKFVATADFAGSTKLLDPGTGKTRAMLTPHSSLVNAVAISADSKLIAGCSYDGTITLWDTAGSESATLVLPKEKILNLAFSPDGQKLVAGCREGNAYLMDVAQHDAPKVLEAYVGPPSYWSGVEAVAFAPDGQSFMTGGMTLRLWRTDSADLIREFHRVSGARVNCLAFAPEGSAVAGVDRDGWLALWDPETGEKINSTHAHDGPAFGLAFSPDGQRLATVCRSEFVVKIWNSQTLALLATFHRR
ncbi:exported hypothetical protein [Verrucomicrobia bacterium]|nr:exported hypothetical protein [Verrucomicrobiota bacterium]